MMADKKVREAAQAFLDAYGSDLDRGNVYISREYSDNLAAARKALSAALEAGKEKC